MTIPKILLIGLALGGAILYLGGCSKESADKLGDDSSSCDTSNVTYTNQVLPIIQANCYICHGPGMTAGSGGIDLSTLDNLRSWAGNGYLVGNVRHDPGYIGMPYGMYPLPACEINTIVAWVHQGTKQ